MSVQKLHAFEKTSIQARHSMKRLEVLVETSKDEQERTIAKELLDSFQKVRNIIPDRYQDIDLKEV